MSRRTPTHSDTHEQIRRYLSATDDSIVLILKDHLMLEERLRGILDRVCRAPDELLAGRLSFYQVLCLCRAIIGRHDESVWESPRVHRSLGSTNDQAFGENYLDSVR